MKTSAVRVTVAWCGCWIGALLLAGCSPSPGNRTADTRAPHRIELPADKAAQMAAKLANDDCERRYHKRPFRPEQYPAVLRDGNYRWGGLDVAGPAGYSALVTFAPDGSNPVVEVYFSSDMLRPRSN